MKTHGSWIKVAGWLLLLPIVATWTAQAQTYPSKPVMTITPAGAAAGPDVIARIVADRLSRAWGQQVLVVNRPGASGLIAAQAAAGASPDGYTLYLPISSTFISLPETQTKLPLDLARDIVPIGLIGEQPMLIAAHPSLGVNTLAELVALAKQKPDQLIYGGGRGTLPHLAGERFQTHAGIKLAFIPYPSTGRAVQDAITGTLPVFIESLSALAGAFQAGSLKPLAVASAKRLPNYPDVPTVAEALPGLGTFEAKGWFALMAPAGTPDAIMRKVSEDLRTVLDDPDVKQKFAALGTYSRPLTPAELATFIRSEQDLWRPVVRQINASQ